ncbi:TetR/AcrR family transcriptional regulator [Mycolicibacterium sp. P9-64]|uniref:TetR/AcrR family transcriptional regulator n=1 Tax=Mycolicibacterium sp. P9-64 TaxID=2024612 RepID=UPI0011EC9371|nr:TetR/AcrR family transcriptional regulator [Mycolicibacterium sp. P9-64]KAA0086683.1 TetR/AcrR family transcriptional regulator [Mycolicibacterium sp. P9-64]
MPRTADPVKRAELLKQVIEYLQEHGVADMSLAPMAAALGTSKRMLLYYFGDRGELLAQALNASRPDVSGMFDDIGTEAEFVAAAQSLWRAITRGAQRRTVGLMLQVLSLAITDPDTYQPYADQAVTLMLDPITRALEGLGYRKPEARVRASLIVSGLRGLCQDGLVTGDSARINAAANLVIAAAVTT